MHDWSEIARCRVRKQRWLYTHDIIIEMHC